MKKHLMFYAAVLLSAVFAPFAVAEVVQAVATAPAVIDPAVDLVGLITVLFGDNAPAIIGWVSFALVLWSQLRQVIPARWLAWLPGPVVTLLEWLASNLGQSANHFENNPNMLKKMK